MSSVMTGGRPPSLPLRAVVSSPSRVDSRMFSRSFSAIAATSTSSSLPGPVGSGALPATRTTSSPTDPNAGNGKATANCTAVAALLITC
ncbi:hypothetical protein [Streptomyces sp. NPDC002564]|uniref:hypothetical protein n=1 Tax=Streptomyces sp. NPDC002564 TaxID=3364649 RepID=UPI0036BFC7A3